MRRLDARKIRYIASGLGVVLVLIGTVAWVRLEVLRIPIAGSSTLVDVDLPATGGLFNGSQATYRGVTVGKVVKLELTTDGVRAVVQLAPSTDIPADTDVKVRSLSPVGEQYLDFQPRTNAGPYLSTGAHLQGSATDLPQSIAEATNALNKLLVEINPAQLKTAVGEASIALAGNATLLQQLLVNSAELSAAYDSKLPEITELISNSQTVLQTGLDTAPELVQIASASKSLTDWLRRYDPQLFESLRRQPAQLGELQHLVGDLTGNLPDLLSAAAPLDVLFRTHAPHLQELLRTSPVVARALADSIWGGSQHVAELFMDAPVCTYTNVVQRAATDTSYRPLQDQGHCPMGGPGLKRGAQYAPGPTN